MVSKKLIDLRISPERIRRAMGPMVGTSGQVLQSRSRSRNEFWSDQVGAELEGSQLSEANTTSTSEADISTVSNLSIPTNQPFFVVAHFSTKGSVSNSKSVGLKLNTTGVRTAIAVGSYGGSLDGYLMAWIGHRQTSYLRGGVIFLAGDSASEFGTVNALSADMPNAIITDVIITGLTASSGEPLYVDEVRVYSYPRS